MLCGLLDPHADPQHALMPAPLRDWTAERQRQTAAGCWRAESVGEGAREKVLRFLVDHPGSSSVQIAAHAGISESTASRRLARMAADGLILSDKRAGRYAWQVTDLGRAALASEHGSCVTGR